MLSVFRFWHINNLRYNYSERRVGVTDGIIIINKEKEYTSNDVVRKVKKILNVKVGHIGTLDPNATGVLPLLLGKGTKLSSYLINHDKEYEVLLELGKKTSTADSEGEIVEERVVDKNIVNEEKIMEVLNTFLGKQKQTPPIYSAIKLKGKKLYEYAREGKEVEIKPREIEIYDIELKDINPELNQISFYVKCSKGTYIRSLCEDIAEKLNTVGYMKELNRISVGEFNIKDSITITELEDKINSKQEVKIISIEAVFEEYPIIKLNDDSLDKYLNGVKIKMDKYEDGLYKIYLDNKFTGIGEINNKALKRKLVII